MNKTLQDIDIPVIGFAAYSGSGKTTVLTKLLAILAERNLRVGVIKHAHHKFDIDHPGKDSYRLREAGASQMLIGSSQRWALMVENEVKENKPLEFYLQHLDLTNLDLVLVEGFKATNISKIEVYRPSLGNKPLFAKDNNIIAVATDEPAAVKTELPLLDLNNPVTIADFITNHFLGNVVPITKRKTTPV